MESFHLPMREVRQRYTLSEVYIMGWRSKEMNANMKRGRKKSTSNEKPSLSKSTPEAHGARVHVEETELAYILPEDINNGVAIPKTFFNADGDLDLSQVSGPQAVRYLNAIGLNIPTILR